jgi:hypothetical protein
MIQTPNLLHSLIPAVRNRVKAAEGLGEPQKADAIEFTSLEGQTRLFERRLLVTDITEKLPLESARSTRQGSKPKAPFRQGRCPDCGLTEGRHQFFCPAAEA